MVKDETILDTLRDLANYCIMTEIEMTKYNIAKPLEANMEALEARIDDKWDDRLVGDIYA